MDRIIARVGEVPAMPEVVGKVLELTDNPDAAMSDISSAIQDDPALTAKILKISNSPYYGMRQYVGTLKLALVILGSREVRNIVLGISVFNVLGKKVQDVALMKDMWFHAVTVGAVAKRLSTTLGLAMQGEDFIAGLLHDIGKMVIMTNSENEYTEVYEESGGHGDKLYAMERQELGYTHSEVGAALAETWNLPKTLCESLLFHHADEALRGGLAAAKDPRLTALIRVANLAAHDDFYSEDAPCAAATDEEAWKELDTAPVAIEKDKRGSLLKQILDEIRQSPPPTL